MEMKCPSVRGDLSTTQRWSRIAFSVLSFRYIFFNYSHLKNSTTQPSQEMVFLGSLSHADEKGAIINKCHVHWKSQLWAEEPLTSVALVLNNNYKSFLETKR